MQGFGQVPLLTAAEEKVLSRAVQALMRMEEAQVAMMKRTGEPVSEQDWADECEYGSLRDFRKALKVRFLPPGRQQYNVSPVLVACAG